MNTSENPWPCAIHNPDNLEPSQFGDLTIWRPATPDETADVPHEVWNVDEWEETTPGEDAFRAYETYTYRIRLADRPWPVAKPAEFPPPPVGHEWHNPGGTPADKLPEDWRLLVKQEVDKKQHHCRMWYDAMRVFSYAAEFLWMPDKTFIVPASTPFPAAELTDADPCPQEPPHGWVEVTSGYVQKHDWMLEPHGFAWWAMAPGQPAAKFYQVHGEGSKIYRHPARMPKAEEKAEPEFPGVEAHMRNSEPFDLQSRAEKAEAKLWQLGEDLCETTLELECTKERAEKAEAILAECMAIMPHGHTPSHTLENLPGRIEDLAKQVAEECTEREKAEAEAKQWQDKIQEIEEGELASWRDAAEKQHARAEKVMTAYEEAVIQLGKKEAELAALKSRTIGVLLPIVEPLPPVPEGGVRKFCAVGITQMGISVGTMTVGRWESDNHYVDIIPAAPDKRAEFEAMWKKGAAELLDWSREEDGQFTRELIERAFQHWLNAGGDK